MDDFSWKTAICRRGPSAPLRHLLSVGALGKPGPGISVLDFGCGRGDDVRHLRDCCFDVRGYDPHPDFLQEADALQHVYDFVLCTYVLNTIPEPAVRERILLDVYARLGWHGVAYVSVRRDKRELSGWKKNGTWQGHIALPFWTTFHETRDYCIYTLDKARFQENPFATVCNTRT